MSARDPEEKNVTNPARPPISTRKLEANRRNAQRSTGPKTPKGKRTISRNATKHGILAGEVVNTALGERREDFYALLKELWEHHKPVGRAEEMDVEKIAVGSWRLKRVFRAENGEIAGGGEFASLGAALTEGRSILQGPPAVGINARGKEAWEARG